MIVKSDVLPQSRAEVDTIGGKTTVTLWDGKYVEHEVDGGDESEKRIEYEFELYQIQVPERPGLAAAVEENFETWLAAAKQQEQDEKMVKAAMDAEKEFEEALPDILLDIDFRLTMKEVFPD